jgi:hypothetical protein
MRGKPLDPAIAQHYNRTEMVLTSVQLADGGKMLVMAGIALFYPIAIAFALVVF